MGKWTTYLMKVHLGKLCVSSNLIQCKSAMHVICLSYLETYARPPAMPDRAFNDLKEVKYCKVKYSMSTKPGYSAGMELFCIIIYQCGF